MGLFSKLEASDVDLIASYGVKRPFPRGAIVIYEGAEGDSCYIILSGRTKVYVSDDQGKEVILNILGAGDYFGELALIDSAPRCASVMALEGIQLFVVSKIGFEKCLSEHPELSLKLMHPLVQCIRCLTLNVKKLAFLDVYGRVARTLLELASDDTGISVIEPRPTHQQIADMVGASREMVTRIMKDLSAGNYISVEKDRIMIAGRLPVGW